MSQEIEELKEMIYKIDKKLDIVIFRTDEQEKEIAKIDKTLNGNGRVGLKTQVFMMWIIGGAIFVPIISAIIYKIFK